MEQEKIVHALEALAEVIENIPGPGTDGMMQYRTVAALERIAITQEKVLAIFAASATAQTGLTYQDLLKIGRDGVQANSVQASPVTGAGGEKPSASTEAPAVETGLSQPAGADREAIKQQLNQLGIKYKPAARTETLQKLLDEAKAAREALASPTTAPSSDTAGACKCENQATENFAGQDITYCTACNLIHRIVQNGKDVPFNHGGKYYPMEQRQAMSKMPDSTAFTREQVRSALIELSAAKGKDTALAVLKRVGKSEKLSSVDPSLYGAVVQECKTEAGTANA